MQCVAEFYKVSFEQFKKDSIKNGFIDADTNDEVIKLAWDAIKLPTRATKGSAGYDFCAPYSFSIQPGVSVTIPTGIRIKLDPGYFLEVVPRSGLGFKHGLRLLNTLGIIDADYFLAENEGHIMVKITVENNMCLQGGDRFCQGLILPHFITKYDEASAERTGGFGSTGA